jgi:hypothetical protein
MQLERSGAQDRISVQEVTIASFAPRTAVRTGPTSDGSFVRIDPPRDAQGRFPADGVAFRLLAMEGGPPPDLELPESAFPLRLDSFHAGQLCGDRTSDGIGRQVVADGRTYFACAWIGGDATAAARASLARVVASLAFPALEPGDVVRGFTVLGPAAAYPAGSLTRVIARLSPETHGEPFYLVHAPGGFYALGWREPGNDRGYRSRCLLELDRSRRELFCRNFAARWDRVGRVLRRPAFARAGDPLTLAVAKVAWDGHVLLYPGASGSATAALVRRLWPAWSAAR